MLSDPLMPRLFRKQGASKSSLHTDISSKLLLYKYENTKTLQSSPRSSKKSLTQRSSPRLHTKLPQISPLSPVAEDYTAPPTMARLKFEQVSASRKQLLPVLSSPKANGVGAKITAAVGDSYDNLSPLTKWHHSSKQISEKGQSQQIDSTDQGGWKEIYGHNPHQSKNQKDKFDDLKFSRILSMEKINKIKKIKTIEH